MATTFDVLLRCDEYTPARDARLERLGAFSRPDKFNEVYRRNRRLPEARRRLAHAREFRRLAAACREHAAIKARRGELFTRRERLYLERLARIQSRVQAENKIRPPGKLPRSIHAFRDKMHAALRVDAEYLAWEARRERADAVFERIRSVRQGLEFTAGVFATDDRAARRAKVAAYRREIQARGEST